MFFSRKFQLVLAILMWRKGRQATRCLCALVVRGLLMCLRELCRYESAITDANPTISSSMLALLYRVPCLWSYKLRRDRRIEDAVQKVNFYI